MNQPPIPALVVSPGALTLFASLALLLVENHPDEAIALVTGATGEQPPAEFVNDFKQSAVNFIMTMAMVRQKTEELQAQVEFEKLPKGMIN